MVPNPLLRDSFVKADWTVNHGKETNPERDDQVYGLP